MGETIWISGRGDPASSRYPFTPVQSIKLDARIALIF